MFSNTQNEMARTGGQETGSPGLGDLAGSTDTQANSVRTRGMSITRAEATDTIPEASHRFAYSVKT
jgi:hypothetical protein